MPERYDENKIMEMKNKIILMSSSIRSVICCKNF